MIRWTMAGVVLLLLGAIAVDRFRHRSNDWTRFDQQTFSVSLRESADELVLFHATESAVVRLIGVDTPDPGKAGFEQSMAYLKARLGTAPEVTVRLEPTQTRTVERLLLAYVYLSDTECLNLSMIRDGKAYADRRMKHTFAGQYEQAEADARKKSRGIWKSLTEDQMPEWRREWLQQLRRERSTTRTR